MKMKTATTKEARNDMDELRQIKQQLITNIGRTTGFPNYQIIMMRNMINCCVCDNNKMNVAITK